LKDWQREESVRTGRCCNHAELTPPERACASHKWHLVTRKAL
jgi:hypothetical protein